MHCSGSGGDGAEERAMETKIRGKGRRDDVRRQAVLQRGEINGGCQSGGY